MIMASVEMMQVQVKKIFNKNSQLFKEIYSFLIPSNKDASLSIHFLYTD